MDKVIKDVEHPTICPISTEVYVSRVPDRTEFQALCDKHVSTWAILEALQG